MKIMIDPQELRDRISLNFHRLADSAYYQIDEVFAPAEYDWQGDKEGRALLAFVSLYKITGVRIPCMEQMLERLPEKLNEKQYMGTVQKEIVSEQQMSGHSWFLRGLCEHYEQFGDDYSLELLKAITENLFLPTRGMYGTYPVNRAK